MTITVSTNGSRLWRGDLLELFTGLPPYRLVVSLYRATEAAYDGLTRRRGSCKAFRRGITAALEAGLPAGKWDLGNHTSSGSLIHLAGNSDHKPAARNDHTEQPGPEPALNRFGSKPLASGLRPPFASSYDGGVRDRALTETELRTLNAVSVPR
jgi:hypothetical protein